VLKTGREMFSGQKDTYRMKKDRGWPRGKIIQGVRTQDSGEKTNKRKKTKTKRRGSSQTHNALRKKPAEGFGGKGKG